MNVLISWRLFPRSLRQLVLLAFLFVLLPLLVLAYQAYQSLSNLSTQAATMNRTTLMDARRSEAMASLALEMERSYRQFCVLQDKTLSELYQKQYQQYVSMLKEQSAILPEVFYSQQLMSQLEKLAAFQCVNNAPLTQASVLLKQFSTVNDQMVQATRTVIYTRGQQLQQAIAQQGKRFGWQALSLFLVSVLLVFLFTRMIIGPVKGVERMLNVLGEGKSVDNTVAFYGPSEIRALAQRIVWLSERLSWLESQRHEFLRHLSHELKTPLASMREGTELLADEVVGTLTSEQKEVVDILDGSSRHLQQLIEQLLDYNRKLVDASFNEQQVDLLALTGRVTAANTLPARTKAIQTHCQLNVEQCWADPLLLERALENLYSNAVYYGAESGIIWIRSRLVGEKVQIDVANSGVPIPRMEQAMIFEPFFQGHLQRKGAVKGSGLGLSIARDCIRQMQGDLYLVTIADADVCFRIELPSTSKG